MLSPPDPPLADDRVRLRPFEPGDVDAVTAACQDPEISRWTTVPSPYTRDHAEEFIHLTAEAWTEGMIGAFAVVSVEDGRLLGSIDLRLASDRSGEIGYWVAPEARREGVATRALRLITEWAHGPLAVPVTTLQIFPGNEPSARVAAAAGYHRAGSVASDTGGRHAEVELWSCLSPAP